jgi:hypothetical protein
MEQKSLASDRSLIDVNFDGYKLSATTLENASLDIDRYWYHCLMVLSFRVFIDWLIFLSGYSPARQVTCDTSAHFSYQYISAFSLHNHLVQDPWDDNCVYYIDENLVIARVSAEVCTYHLSSLVSQAA